MSIYTLALESSCDETSASVLKDGRTVLSNVISSQVPIHRKFGGVVPEIASRHHIEQVIPVIDQALRDANVTLQDINHIGVTYGPGLVGALLVGVAAAKGLSFATGIPLVPVHHMEGHIFANFLANPELEPPFLSLVVSGGHTMLVHVKDMKNLMFLVKHEMTQLARLLIRLHGLWDSLIQGALISMPLPLKGIQRLLNFQRL